MFPFEFIRNLTCISARYFSLWQLFPDQTKKQMEASRNSCWQYSAFSGTGSKWMLSGDNSSSLSVPHDKFSIHVYINHLCRMLFPGGRQTTLALSSLVGEN